MNDLNIVIKALLDQASVQDINAALKKIKDEYRNITIKLDLDQNVANTLNQIAANIDKTTSGTQRTNMALQQQGQIITSNVSQLDKYTEIWTGAGEKVSGLSTKISESTTALGEQLKVTQQLDRESGKVLSTAEQTTINHKEQLKEVEKLINAMAKGREASFSRQRNEDRKAELAQSKAINKSIEDEAKANAKLAEQMGKVREQSMARKAKADKSAELAQTKAINKAMEEQMIKQRQLMGTYEGLKAQTASTIELQRILTDTYKEREVRQTSLDTTTGKWSAIVSESATQQLKLKGTLDQTTGSLYVQSSAFEQVRNRNLGFMQELGIAMKRIPVWMIGMTAFYQTLRFFTNGVKYVNELDKALTEVSIVTGQTQGQVSALGMEYQRVAKEMAVSTKQIAEASVTFYRQGLDQAEVVDRVRISTQLAKIANIEFAQSSEIITSITNGLGVSAQRAADAIIAVGDSTATSASELGSAIQKVSGTAGALGIEFELLVAQISTISAKTRESAESVGNSLKTMYQRMVNLREAGFDEEDGTRINDVAKALATVDIALTDSEGNFRDLGLIISELGEKWSTLDNRTSSYIASVMAGVRQASRFQTLMEGHSETMEMYAVGMDSAGVSLEKYNKYLQSTEAYLNVLNTTATGVWQKVFDSDTIRGGITLITKVVEGFDWLVSTLGFIPSVAIPATIALGVFSTVAKGVLISAGSFITAAAGSATLLSSILATIPPLHVAVAAVGALSFAINGIVNSVAKAQAKMQETEEMNRQMLDSYDSQGNQIDSLVDKYTSLASKSSLSATQQKELRTVQNELNSLLPQLTASVDKNGDAHLRSADAVASEIEYIKELKKLQDEQFIGEFESKIEKQNRTISNLLKSIEKLSKSTVNIEKYIDDDGIERYRELNETIEERNKRERELLAVQREVGLEEEARISMYAEMVSAKLNAAGATEKLTTEEQKYVDTLAREQDLTGDNIFQYDQFINKITDLIEHRNILNSTIEDSSKHLTVEQTAILNRLGLMDDEIQGTGLLTDALIKLAKARLQERMSADAAFKNVGRDGYVSGHYISPYAAMLRDIDELEQSLRLRSPIVSSRSGSSGSVSSGTKEFSKQFDFASAKVDELDAKLEKLKATFSRLSEEEDKQKIYDQMLAVYDDKRRLLEQMRSYYEREFTKADQAVQKLISQGKIAFDDQNKLFATIKDEAAANAIEKFQRLQSELRNTQSAIRSVESSVYDLGQTMRDTFEQELQNRVKLSFYLMEKEIAQLENARQIAKDVADEKIKALELQINALEKQADAIKENEEREKRQVELLELQIRLRNTMNEKNIRQLRQKADGTFNYVYVADPEKVESLNDEIGKRIEDFNRWERENTRKHQVDSLRRQIDSIREELREDENRYNRQIKNLRDFKLRYEDEQNEFFGDNIDGLDAFMRDLMGIESTGYNERLTLLAAFIASYNALMAGAKSAPSVPDAPGSSTGGSIGSGGSSGSSGSSSTWESEIWGQEYRIEADGYRIYKDGRYIPAENFKYLPKDVVEKAREMKKNAASFGGGGRTPAWGPEGKLGVLHEKERVLDQEQTRSFEKLVDNLPTIKSLIDNVSVFKNASLGTPRLQLSLAGTGGIQQSVNVGKLVFPNVKDSKEIEGAIRSLSTYANQWANRR